MTDKEMRFSLSVRGTKIRSLDSGSELTPISSSRRDYNDRLRAFRFSTAGAMNQGRCRGFARRQDQIVTCVPTSTTRPVGILK